MSKQDKPIGKIAPYTHPAAGWDALRYVAQGMLRERVPPAGIGALLAQNQPDGFDCPDRYSTRLNSSHAELSRMPSCA